MKNLKNIKSYLQFVNEEEVPQIGGGVEATEGSGGTDSKKGDEKKGIENLPRLDAVVEKEFFSELKEHVFYWFNYDFLKDKYVIDTLKNTNNSVDIWFSENKDISDYTYKVVYTNNVNDSSSFEKVENVKVMVSIYEYDSNNLLKQTEESIDIKYLNSESFNKLVNKVKKRILIAPTSQKDVDKFNKKETRTLGDNIY